MTPKSRATVLAAAIFGSAGLAVGSAVVFSGPLKHPWIYVASVFAAWFAAAFAYGVRRSRRTGAFPRLGGGLLWGALFATAFAVPVGLRWLQLWRITADIPRAEPVPGSWNPEDDYFRFNGVPDFRRLQYRTALPFDDVCRLYDEQIPERGWTLKYQATHGPMSQIDRGHVRTHYGRKREYLFDRDGRETFIAVWETVRDRPGESAVIVEPRERAEDNDEPPPYFPRL